MAVGLRTAAPRSVAGIEEASLRAARQAPAGAARAPPAAVGRPPGGGGDDARSGRPASTRSPRAARAAHAATGCGSASTTSPTAGPTSRREAEPHRPGPAPAALVPRGMGPGSRRLADVPRRPRGRALPAGTPLHAAPLPRMTGTRPRTSRSTSRPRPGGSGRASWSTLRRRMSARMPMRVDIEELADDRCAFEPGSDDPASLAHVPGHAGRRLRGRGCAGAGRGAADHGRALRARRARSGAVSRPARGRCGARTGRAARRSTPTTP